MKGRGGEGAGERALTSALLESHERLSKAELALAHLEQVKAGSAGGLKSKAGRQGAGKAYGKVAHGRGRGREEEEVEEKEEEEEEEEEEVGLEEVEWE